MIDFGRIEGFDWDDGNDRKNFDKHGVGQLLAEQALIDPMVLVVPDEKHSESELRYHALGKTADGLVLQLTFTLRDNGQKLRVISARPANRKERALYEEA
jgi:uncharacterized DUF497 family protein